MKITFSQSRKRKEQYIETIKGGLFAAFLTIVLFYFFVLVMFVLPNIT